MILRVFRVGHTGWNSDRNFDSDYTEMKKKLKICNIALLALSVLMLVSAIQLEVTGGRSVAFVWLHIVSGILFASNIGWHIQLHYRWRNWLKMLWKRTAVIKWLTATGILTLLSGLWATGEWFVMQHHSYVGAVHGKIGFLMMVFVVIHIIRKIKFYR